jgi:hypothetical protein
VCGATEAVELDLPRSLDAPARARDLVEQHLCREHGRVALAAAQLLVSELVTCAVLYGEAPITLRIDCGVTLLRIAVTHRVEGDAPAEIPIDEDGGLRRALLTKLSRSWGVDVVDGERTLWSRLPTGAIPERPVQVRSQPPGRVVSLTVPREPAQPWSPAQGP